MVYDGPKEGNKNCRIASKIRKMEEFERQKDNIVFSLDPPYRDDIVYGRPLSCLRISHQSLAE
jgi:hypothetical protein